MNKILMLSAAVLLSNGSHANWVCNVSNNKEQQLTFSAPKEEEADALANAICSSEKIGKEDCLPDCYDTGSNQSRWHCSIQNQKKQSWSFTTADRRQAEKFAQIACASKQIAANDCKPVCTVE